MNVMIFEKIRLLWLFRLGIFFWWLIFPVKLSAQASCVWTSPSFWGQWRFDFWLELSHFWSREFHTTLIFFYSQWCGLGGSSLGCATVELAKLLKAADDGFIQSGTRLQFIWSWINLCNLSLTFETHVNSRSQTSSNGRSATGSKSVVYRLGPLFEPPLLAWNKIF